MHFTLLADRIDRAGVNTSSAVDTLIINCVGHGTFLLFGICLSRNFPSEFTATGKFCPAQSKPKNTCNFANRTLPFHNMFYAFQAL
jgi:hypothetical protein